MEYNAAIRAQSIADAMRFLQRNLPQHPTAGWLVQQIVEAFPLNATPAYLVRGNDATHMQGFRPPGSGDGHPRPTDVTAPWQNPYVERLIIGTARRLEKIVLMKDRSKGGHYAHCRIAKPNKVNLSALCMIAPVTVDHAMPRRCRNRLSKLGNSRSVSAHWENGTQARYSSCILPK